MKAITVAQVLLLQKPSRTSKSSDHVKHLKRRLDLWQNRDIHSLTEEGRCLQQHLHKTPMRTGDEAVSRTFCKLMMEGKVHNALSYLSRNTSGGVLKLEDLIETTSSGDTVLRSIYDILQDKHPQGKTPTPECLVNVTPQSPAIHPILYDNLNGDAILQAALRTQGAAGPAGLDAYAWRRMYTSFKSASRDLCQALAAVGRRICTTHVHSDGLEAFVASRLIPLHKCPGVRPIGVGEVPRRIIAKAVLRIVGGDIKEAAGPLQACAGQEGGCEAAVHAMRHIFQSPESEAVLLVDATNAFKSLNRLAALHNISVTCPPLAQILINTYRAPIRMIIPGSGEIASSEGTTQGDPLAMAMYSLAITPFIHQLSSSCPGVQQVWFADDATGASTCTNLKSWWNELSARGPAFGYHPNGSKTYLVVKQEYETNARQLFDDTDVHITIQGKRHLGAAIGSRSFTEEYVSHKVQTWTEEIKRLAKVATSQPHAAYAAFTHGLSSPWTYLLRTIPDIQDLLIPLENEIHQTFILALTGRSPCSKVERDLLSLPVRLGGLGLTNPVTLSQHAFNASRRLTAPLTPLIIAQETNETANPDLTHSLKRVIRTENRQRQDQQAKNTYAQLSPQLRRCIDLAAKRGSSSWLTALPLTEHGFHLHKGEFWDAICLRYDWALKNTPTTCSCAATFSIYHAMTCHTGGFPTIRHNEIRDITASLLTEVCHSVATEPPLQSLSGELLNPHSANREDGARLDIRARGFWNRAQDAFFDVRVFHPNASSYRSMSLQGAFRRHEQAKKREYGERVREVEDGVFTPLVLSTTGSLGREATTFYKRLANLISIKQQVHYSQVMCWLRCSISMAVLRSAIRCVRGSRLYLHRPVCEMNITLASSEGRLT